MKTKEVLKLVLTSVLLFGCASVFAEESADDPANVWT